jgi:apolipoprotein N-acyltransferase
MTPLLQIASFTGVYGISFLIIWFSVSLLMSGMALIGMPSRRQGWVGEIALPLLTIVGITVLGYRVVTNFPLPKRTVKVALIQPSIPQTLIWDQRENDTRFKQLLELSEKALREKPDLIIWPEASVPNMIRQADIIRKGEKLGIFNVEQTRDALEYYQEFQDAITGLMKKHRVWAIIGSDDAVFQPNARSEKEIDYYNSAFAISPTGELAAHYRKRRLVIFGEYVPFVKLLPFLKVLSPAGDSGFTPGEKATPFHLWSLGVTAGVLICFEDTFPHLARHYVTEDTDFLVNLTNNGWFGESAAQWQHAATSAYRAIENRLPLVRCANNGLTCWVDAVGRMHNIYYPGTRDIYGPGFKIAEIPVLPKGGHRDFSFYTRFGDVFGWSCFGLMLARILFVFRRERKWTRSGQTKAPEAGANPPFTP